MWVTRAKVVQVYAMKTQVSGQLHAPIALALGKESLTPIA